MGLFYWAKSFSCSDAPTVWFGRFGQIVLSNRGFGQFWQSITELRTLVILFRQTEIVLKDSTAFVYVTKSEKSTHFTLMT